MAKGIFTIDLRAYFTLVFFVAIPGYRKVKYGYMMDKKGIFPIEYLRYNNNIPEKINKISKYRNK